jgi:uncharacterized protein (TIGR02996 family)
MVHPAEFWHDILDSPADDRPRLRYADWLACRDHTLSDFIHLQCRLAQDSLCPHKAGELACRERELLADNSALWAGPLVGRVEWWAFRRGFVEEVSLGASQLVSEADDLFHDAPLQDLHVTPDGAELEQLPRVAELRRTVFLDLSAHPLGDAGLIQLAQAPFLSHVHGLNLTSCGLDGAGLQALGESPHVGCLRELYLCDNTIDDAAVRHLALTPLLERLDILYLRLNPLSDEALGLLRRILGDRVHF